MSTRREPALLRSSLAGASRVGCWLIAALWLLHTGPAWAQASSAEAPPARTESGKSASTVEGQQEVPTGQEQAPDVIPPQVTHYEPPVYPPEAFEQGLTAEVDLQITVQEDGTVVDPEVVTPRGHGFDEAARAAALKLRFSPALVEGIPRAVRIGFRYSFTLDPKLMVEEEEVEARLGEIGGQLLLSKTEAPLPGVEVVLVDGLGSEYVTTTDELGKWRLQNMPPGTYRLRVTVDGFEKIESEERIVAGEATELTLRLLDEVAANEVVIYGERPPREMTRRTLERREIERIPGTNGDALRSLQSLPGVARPPGLAGLLIVRGSAPQDTGTFVDGEEVPLIYHFGGLSSVIPTELLDKIDFYPGNFSVRYGRFRGGIVDTALRKPNTDCYGDYGVATERTGCYHGMVQADFIDGRVLLQGPIPGTKNWSFALAGRRSWIDLPLKPILEAAGASVTSAPVYWDYQAIVERNLGPNDKLSFRLFGSDDGLEILVSDPAAQDPGFGGNLRFGTSFLRGQVLYQKALTKKVNLDAMVSVGTQRIDFELGGNLKFELRTMPIDVRSELGFQVHPKAKLNVGLDFQTGSYDAFVRAPPLPVEGQAAESLASQIIVESKASGYYFRPAWYSDLEWQPTKRLRFVPGIRLDYARDALAADVSPRLTARYALFLPEDNAWWGKPLATTLKAGIGKFSQPPQFQETDEVFGTPGVASNQSIHYSLGFEQDITSQVMLSMEGYYKDFYNTVTGAAGQGQSTQYENDGSGRAIGMETLLKYKPDQRFFGWIAYTLSQSLARNCPSCELNHFTYDQTHNLVILGSYRLGRGWEFGARFRLVSGNLVTPVIPGNLPAIYDADSGTYLPLQGEPNSERLPLFHQLDLRVDKRWQFRTWRFSFYVDVQNVYNNPAEEAFVYNYNYSQRAYQSGLPIIPSLGLRGEF